MKEYQQREFPDWVFAKEGDVHTSLFSLVNYYDKSVGSLTTRPSTRLLLTYLGRASANLYANGQVSDLDINGQLNMSPTLGRVGFNITSAIIDTLQSKLASLDTVPQVVTNKGTAKGRRLAEELNFLVKGLFHKHNITSKINLIYRDAMIFGSGFLKIIKTEDGNIDIERIMPDEVIIDAADGYYNDPFKFIHYKHVPVQTLIKLYPEYKVKILQAATATPVRTGRPYTPTILVCEAWAKNTYCEKGRHVICIENCDILDEEWDKDYFPILKVDYKTPVIGWKGISVVENLDSIQREIDRILATMQAIMKIISVPRIFMDSNSQVNPQSFTNKVGVIIYFDGKNGIAPIINNGSGMPPELPAQLKSLIEMAYAQEGLTTTDTQGQSNTGTLGHVSAEAIRKMSELRSERWKKLETAYEQSHVEMGQLILDELRGTNFKLSALDRSIGLKEVSTKTIPKTKDSYVLKIFPVSALPDSIPDLIESVQEMLKLGVVQPSQVPDLFNIPDVDAYVTMQSAPKKLIDSKIEEMIETKKYWFPEPYHDLNYALVAALQHYNWAQLNNEDEKVLKLLRRFINDLKTLLSQVPIPQPVQQSQSQPVQQPQQ